MAAEYYKSSLARRVGVTAVALAVLSAGAAFALRGGTNPVDCKTEFISATATGGLAKYPFIQWQEPVDDSGSGSEIHKIYWSIGRSPVSVGVDFTIGPSATVSGAIAVPNLTDFQTSSGATALFSTGSIKVNSGSYLRGVTLRNPGSGHQSTVAIEYCTRLSK
jgi:hypothetical protein